MTFASDVRSPKWISFQDGRNFSANKGPFTPSKSDNSFWFLLPVSVNNILNFLASHLKAMSLSLSVDEPNEGKQLTDGPGAWMLLNTPDTRIFFRRCALTCVLPGRWNYWRLCRTRDTTLPWRPRVHRSWPGALSLWVYLRWVPIHWEPAYSLNPMKTTVLVVLKVVAEHCVHYLLLIT